MLKLNIQMFGGRGASSSNKGKKVEKTIEQLNNMAKKLRNKDNSNYNFLTYNYEGAKLSETFESARAWAERGGQVLVIDKQKIYTFKTKNEEEYMKYLKGQIRRENREKMNKYGL